MRLEWRTRAFILCQNKDTGKPGIILWRYHLWSMQAMPRATWALPLAQSPPA
nr:MAG TPA: hypothetical protein [Caudoviricetes sp.]